MKTVLSTLEVYKKVKNFVNFVNFKQLSIWKNTVERKIVANETEATKNDCENTIVSEKIISTLSSFEKYLHQKENSQERSTKIEGSYYQNCNIVTDNGKMQISDQSTVVELKETLQDVLSNVDDCKKDFMNAIEVVNENVNELKNEIKQLNSKLEGFFLS